MTVQERLELFWRGERPDRIPYTAYGFFFNDKLEQPAFRRLTERGLGRTAPRGACGRRAPRAGNPDGRVGKPDAAAAAQASFIQRQSSGTVGLFPVARRPARKTFAVAFRRKTIVATERTSESATCQAGGSETRIRMNIVIGV